MTKVMTIVGTRPEIIRLSRVIARLDSTVEHVLVHTGQNYDYTLNGVFFDDLGLRPPAHVLDVDTSSLGAVLGGVLVGTERVLAEERPDAVVVLGDTNSCIAALMARRMNVPVYHLEAGNRSFDLNVPEETNRRMVDHVSDFNLVYTEHARRNLLAEGVHPRRISLVGSPMREVLEHSAAAIAASDVLDRCGLAQGGYFLVSAHRAENVDDPVRLRALLDCLVAVRRTWDLPVLVSTHPRTRARIEALGADAKAEIDPQAGPETDSGIRFADPFGFLDYVQLQRNARCVLSDSGTIAEESAILGFPAVTLRDSLERPEALDTGAIVMTGLEPVGVVEAVTAVLAQDEKGVRPECPEAYRISDTSLRTVNFLLSTVRRHHQWAGIRVGNRAAG